MGADLPDSTDEFIPGITVPDPDYASRGQAGQPLTVRACDHPIGMPTAARSWPTRAARWSSSCPTSSRAASQPTSHRKLSITCLPGRAVQRRAWRRRTSCFIISNGLHPRSTVQGRCWPSWDPSCSTSSGPPVRSPAMTPRTPEHMVDLGFTKRGDPVLDEPAWSTKPTCPSSSAMSSGNPYGGYSGGYKHCATGITHWKSIASHHVPQVMHRRRLHAPSTNSSLMRDKFDEIGMHMEEKMGHPFFCCDAVLDTKSRQIAIYSGYAKEMHARELEDRPTSAPTSTGPRRSTTSSSSACPRTSTTATAWAPTPSMMMQALSAQVHPPQARHERPTASFICSSHLQRLLPRSSAGPTCGSCYELFQHDHMNILPDMNRLRRVLRHQRGVHPQVPLRQRLPSLPRLLHDELRPHRRDEHQRHLHRRRPRSRAIARGMGLKTRATFEEALEDAKQQVCRPEPQHPGSAPDLQDHQPSTCA